MPKKVYPSTLAATAKNIRRMTFYLGYGDIGDVRKRFLARKAKDGGYKGIAGLLHALVKAKFPDFPE